MSERDRSPKLQEEKRVGRLAGFAAFGSVLASVAALGVATRGTSNGISEPGAKVSSSDADQMRELIDFHNTANSQLVAAGLRSLGVLLCVGVGLFIYWLVRRRDDEVVPWLKRAAIGGPVAIVVASLFGYLALKGVADTFTQSGPRTADRASDLFADDAKLKVAFFLDIGSRVVFGAWVVLGSLALMRVGFVTAFLGYWGVAAGVIQVFPVGIGDAMFIGWLASIAFLSLGYWPGGRPEAWDTEALQVGPAA